MFCISHWEKTDSNFSQGPRTDENEKEVKHALPNPTSKCMPKSVVLISWVRLFETWAIAIWAKIYLLAKAHVSNKRAHEMRIRESLI